MGKDVPSRKHIDQPCLGQETTPRGRMVVHEHGPGPGLQEASHLRPRQRPKLPRHSLDVLATHIPGRRHLPQGQRPTGTQLRHRSPDRRPHPRRHLPLRLQLVDLPPPAAPRPLQPHDPPLKPLHPRAKHLHLRLRGPPVRRRRRLHPRPHLQEQRLPGARRSAARQAQRRVQQQEAVPGAPQLRGRAMPAMRGAPEHPAVGPAQVHAGQRAHGAVPAGQRSPVPHAAAVQAGGGGGGPGAREPVPAAAALLGRRVLRLGPVQGVHRGLSGHEVPQQQQVQDGLLQPQRPLRLPVQAEAADEPERDGARHDAQQGGSRVECGASRPRAGPESRAGRGHEDQHTQGTGHGYGGCSVVGRWTGSLCMYDTWNGVQAWEKKGGKGTGESEDAQCKKKCGSIYCLDSTVTLSTSITTVIIQR